MRRLFAMPARDVAGLTEAFVYHAVARALIRYVRFSRWRRLLGPIGSSGVARPVPGPHAPHTDADALTVAAVGRHVARAAARAPFRAVCLPQAMAARHMLRRRGIASEIVLGAAPARAGGGDRALDLHAWLMVGAVCVTGRGYRRFSAFAVQDHCPDGSPVDEDRTGEQSKPQWP